MKRLWLFSLALLVLLLALSGCETFRGFGKDMQRAGKSIERAANK